MSQQTFGLRFSFSKEDRTEDFQSNRVTPKFPSIQLEKKIIKSQPIIKSAEHFYTRLKLNNNFIRTKKERNQPHLKQNSSLKVRIEDFNHNSNVSIKENFNQTSLSKFSFECNSVKSVNSLPGKYFKKSTIKSSRNILQNPSIVNQKKDFRFRSRKKESQQIKFNYKTTQVSLSKKKDQVKIRFQKKKLFGDQKSNQRINSTEKISTPIKRRQIKPFKVQSKFSYTYKYKPQFGNRNNKLNNNKILEITQNIK